MPETLETPAPEVIEGFIVSPTVNSNGSDAGGAKLVCNGVQYRLTKSGGMFTREVSTKDSHPWHHTEDFLSVMARVCLALKKFQQRHRRFV